MKVIEGYDSNIIGYNLKQIYNRKGAKNAMQVHLGGPERDFEFPVLLPGRQCWPGKACCAYFHLGRKK